MDTLCNFELSQWLFVHHFSWCSLPKRLSKVRSAILQILSLIVILNSSASSSSLSSQLWSSILMSSTAKKNYTHKSSVKIVLTMLNDFETLFCIGLRAHTSTTGNLIIINYDSFFKKNWQTPASFIIYFRSFQANIITIFTTNMWEMSIQYKAPGVEPTTFGTWVSSHDH